MSMRFVDPYFNLHESMVEQSYLKTAGTMMVEAD